LREPGSLFEIAGTVPDTPTFSLEQAVADRDAPLRADVRTMGSLLGQIIQDHHGEVTFDKIEKLRSLAKAWRDVGAGRKQNADAQFAELAEYCTQLDNEELHIISRAFTHFLAIANAAESHHRSRLLSMMESENALPNKSDSCGGVLASLLKEHSSETILQALTSQKVELVLTAHPTEVNRRTILEKKRRVQEVRTSVEME
jgi:phosphoenolpyruvate carboxylase